VIGEHAMDWGAILGEVLDQPGRTRPHFQPIVDLQRGEVCGYEALARFTGWMDLEPTEVFAAADRLGIAGAVEAQMVREVLEARAHIAPNHLLSVNCSPRALMCEEVHDAFGALGRLDSIIIEVTEQTDTDLDALAGALAELRGRGALVAVDDAGAGYASLARITALEPHFVKVDRSLVSGIDKSPAKCAVVETLGDLAARMDAWVVAEGIERREELDTLIRMHVPLGQGFAFGRPGPGLSALDAELGGHIRSRFRPAQVTPSLATLIEAVPMLPEPVSGQAIDVLFARRPGPEYIALVDGQGRPSGLVRRGDIDAADPIRSLLVLSPETPLPVATRRAMGRPSAHRFDPVVCVDDGGRYAGLVRIERLVDALASAA
jgi:EAL domain-containing protein (putative c-di-GMP-specific phosphodiesterase class I)